MSLSVVLFSIVILTISDLSFKWHVLCFSCIIEQYHTYSLIISIQLMNPFWGSLSCIEKKMNLGLKKIEPKLML